MQCVHTYGREIVSITYRVGVYQVSQTRNVLIGYVGRYSLLEELGYRARSSFSSRNKQKIKRY